MISTASRSSSATGPRPARRPFWLAALLLAQTIGIFSKESAAVLPAVLLLYDLTCPNRPSWRARAPFYAALAAPLAAYLYLRSTIPTRLLVHFFENPLSAAGFLESRLTAIKVIGRYLYLFLWPARLSADYSYNAVPVFHGGATWDDAQALLALGLCAASVVFAIRARRTRPLFLFFLGFFFVSLAPVSNIFVTIGSIMAERFLYLPSIGLAGCVILALRPAFARRLPFAAVALICLALALRTYARNPDWHSELTLWTATVAAVPQSARPHNNLCNALADIPGRLPDAARECTTALQILPDYADAHYNLGRVLARMPGRLPEAAAEYQAAVVAEPAFALAHQALGAIWTQTPGRQSDALSELTESVRLDPANAPAHNSLGAVLSDLPGRLPDAIAEFQSALRLDPANAKAHNNLGNALARLPNRLPDAIAEYRAALRLRPDFADAHFNLANALAQTPGASSEAIAEYRAALALDPALFEAHANLAAVLARSPEGRPEAIRELQAAIRLHPHPALQQMLDRLLSN